MRPDMYKVIVERPRREKRMRPLAIRFRNNLDSPAHEHIDQFIATRVGLRDGRLIDFTNGRCLPLNGFRHQELYVDPHSGLIRLTNIDSDWKRDRAERRRHNAAIIQSQHKPLTVDGNETSLRAEQVNHVPFFKVFSWRCSPRSVTISSRL